MTSSVADDGSGSPPGENIGCGRGLIGMRERVALAGGRMVETGPTGQGFRVSAQLPVGLGDLPYRADDQPAADSKASVGPTR